MSSKKNRVTPKIKNQTILPTGTNLISKAGCSGKTESPGRTTDIKDPLGDNDGMPFILVDAVNMRNRHQLQVALAKIERKRMETIEKECSLLPLLTYTREPKTIRPISEFEKEIQDELEFEADLKMLSLDLLSGDEQKDTLYCTESTTPIPYVNSAENLQKNEKKLNEIRQKLQKLRRSQQCETANQSSAHSAALTYQTVSEPKLTRQGTFEVPPEEQLANSKHLVKHSVSSPVCLKSINVRAGIPSPQKLTRSATIHSSAECPNGYPIKKCSTTYLFKNKSYNEMQTNNNKTSKKQSSTELPKIINQIGDLLLQLPNQQQEIKKLEPKKGPLSYLVTISPTANVSVESAKSQTDSKSNSQVMIPKNIPCAPQRLSYSECSLSRNPVITIFTPVPSNTDTNSLFQSTLQHDENKFQSLCNNPMNIDKNLSTSLAADQQPRRDRRYLELPSRLSTKARK